MMTIEDRSNYNFQKIVVAVGVLLFLIKITAWYLTGSVAILTDALESITNVLAGSFTLYSLYLSAKPKDDNHPHGHGKIEFVSAGIEGTLIVIAGLFILVEAFKRLYFGGSDLQRLDFGLLLVGVTSVINYLVGHVAIKRGEKNNVLPLVAGGEHLKSDAYSTLGLMIGLILIMLTGYVWIDGVVALIFGAIIIYTGVKIIREAVAGIMDEADEDLIELFVKEAAANRSEYWIDLHKVRFIKYGNHVHLDCHLTLPWYFTLREAHVELDKLSNLLADKFDNRYEMYVHTDDCQDFSCEICPLLDCVHRRRRFVERVEWTSDNVAADKKHSVHDLERPEPQTLFCHSFKREGEEASS